MQSNEMIHKLQEYTKQIAKRLSQNSLSEMEENKYLDFFKTQSDEFIPVGADGSKIDFYNAFAQYLMAYSTESYINNSKYNHFPGSFLSSWSYLDIDAGLRNEVNTMAGFPNLGRLKKNIEIAFTNALQNKDGTDYKYNLDDWSTFNKNVLAMKCGNLLKNFRNLCYDGIKTKTEFLDETTIKNNVEKILNNNRIDTRVDANIDKEKFNQLLDFNLYIGVVSKILGKADLNNDKLNISALVDEHFQSAYDNQINAFTNSNIDESFKTPAYDYFINHIWKNGIDAFKNHCKQTVNRDVVVSIVKEIHRLNIENSPKNQKETVKELKEEIKGLRSQNQIMLSMQEKMLAMMSQMQEQIARLSDKKNVNNDDAPEETKSPHNKRKPSF